MADLPVISAARLALYNGFERPEICVTCKVWMYEATSSRLWRGGMHDVHRAVQDLTVGLKDAPHTSRVLARFRVVGKLAP